MAPPTALLRAALRPLALHIEYRCRYWQHGMDIDPLEMLQNDTRMRAYLARYGRQDLFAWDNREFSEMRRYFNAISDIVKGESGVTTED